MQKQFSPAEKAAILKEHFIQNQSITTILAKYNINQTTFDRWKKSLYAHSELVFKEIPSDGMDYTMNYDAIVTWFANIFRGKTLEIIGIKTDPIKNVCSYKPVNIIVSSGMVDIILEDISGNCYHLEEQRNMTEKDLYRFAGYHFSAASEWNDKVQDILLVSGTSYTGKRKIETPNGTYHPKIIDFTTKDGFKRLEEIKIAAEDGNTDVLLELIFVPLYGKKNNKQLAQSVIEFELSLCKRNKLSELILAATLIMSNKILDTETLAQIWRELKMIDIFAYAHEKGREEGLERGLEKGIEKGHKKGLIENAREMLITALEETVGIIPEYIATKINEITQKDTLKGLFKQAIKCKDIGQFEQMLTLATAQKV